MSILKAIYESREEIPEAFAELYEERGGQWILTQIDGIQTDANIARLERAAAQERESHKKTQAQLAAWGELNPEETISKLDRITELEAAAEGKMDDDKIDKLVAARLERERAPLERENKKLSAAVAERDEKITAFQTREDERAIRKAALEAAKKAGVPADALPDVEMSARYMLRREEGTGEVVSKDGVGVTPNVGPDIWISDMLPKRPTWNPPSQGGGARGTGVKIAGLVGNPWTLDHWNLTAQGKVLREHGAEKAKQLAEAAGTTLGGGKPRK